MALQKDIETPTGAIANYWKIVKADFNYRGNSCVVSLAGFLNEQARLDNKPQLQVKKFVVPVADSDQATLTFETVREYLYQYIKGIPDGEFSDAEDV